MSQKHHSPEVHSVQSVSTTPPRSSTPTSRGASAVSPAGGGSQHGPSVHHETHGGGILSGFFKKVANGLDHLSGGVAAHRVHGEDGGEHHRPLALHVGSDVWGKDKVETSHEQADEGSTRSQAEADAHTRALMQHAAGNAPRAEQPKPQHPPTPHAERPPHEATLHGEKPGPGASAHHPATGAPRPRDGDPSAPSTNNDRWTSQDSRHLAKGLASKSGALKGSTEAWSQGGQGDCSAVATIKLAMNTYGNQVFSHVQQTRDGGFNVTMQDGHKVSLSRQDMDTAQQMAGFQGKGSESKSYAVLAYAAMAKREQTGHHGGESFRQACQTLDSGQDPVHAAHLLGLEHKIQAVDPGSLNRANAAVAWSDQHAVVVSQDGHGHLEADHYGHEQGYNGTDTVGHRNLGAFTFRGDRGVRGAHAHLSRDALNADPTQRGRSTGPTVTRNRTSEFTGPGTGGARRGQGGIDASRGSTHASGGGTQPPATATPSDGGSSTSGGSGSSSSTGGASSSGSGTATGTGTTTGTGTDTGTGTGTGTGTDAGTGTGTSSSGSSGYSSGSSGYDSGNIYQPNLPDSYTSPVSSIDSGDVVGDPVTGTTGMGPDSEAADALGDGSQPATTGLGTDGATDPGAQGLQGLNGEGTSGTSPDGATGGAGSSAAGAPGGPADGGSADRASAGAASGGTSPGGQAALQATAQAVDAGLSKAAAQELNQAGTTVSGQSMAKAAANLMEDMDVGQQGEQIFNDLTVSTKVAVLNASDPQNMLARVLTGVAEGRSESEAMVHTAPGGLDENSPEMRLLRGAAPEPEPAEPQAASGTSMPLRIAGPNRPLRPQEIESAVGQAFHNIDSGNARPDDFESLAFISTQPSGASRVADALEAVVTGPQGPRRMMDLMDQASANPEVARAMSQTLAQVADVTPTRTVGTLLLTTDHEGGAQSVARMFGEMSQDKQGALNLASFFERSTRNPDAARGMGELLDTITAPQEGDRAGSRQVAQAFSNATNWVSGSRNVAQGFVNTLDADGGARSFARLVNRLSSTSAGADATGDTLRHMSFDKSGTQAVGTLLARSSQSRDGARQLLDSLNRIAETDSGKRDVATVLNRVSQTPTGARLLLNLTADDSNLPAFTSLMDRLGQDGTSRARVTAALDNITSQRSSQPDVNRLITRVDSNAALKQSFSSLEWAPPETGEAVSAMPLTSAGVSAMSQAAASTVQAAPTPGTATPASAPATGAAPVEAPARQAAVPTSGPSADPVAAAHPLPNSSGASTDANAAVSTAPAAASGPAAASTGHAAASGPAAASTAHASESAPAAASAAHTAASAVSTTAPGPAGPARSPGAPGAGSGGADLGGNLAGSADAARWIQLSGPTGTRKAGEASGVQAAGALSASDGPSPLDHEPRQLLGFRPGDVYSQDTLRQARICPDCGFRLSAGGDCARCKEFQLRGLQAPHVLGAISV